MRPISLSILALFVLPLLTAAQQVQTATEVKPHPQPMSMESADRWTNSLRSKVRDLWRRRSDSASFFR